MQWQLILEEFGHNIQHIAEVDNIVYDALTILTCKSVNKYDHSTGKAQCCANKLFVINREETTSIIYH